MRSVDLSFYSDFAGFDVYQPTDGGRLRLSLSRPCDLFIRSPQLDKTIYFGNEKEFDLVLAPDAEFMVVEPPVMHDALGAVVPFFGSVIVRLEEFIDVDEVVLTNVDRMPTESGALADIQAATRRFEILRQQALNEIKTEKAAFEDGRTYVDTSVGTDSDPIVTGEQEDGDVV
jgi:hypothetical protein